ncbi:MAG: hypothetical protein AVDCRST_MAG34-1802 [uncultured Nocardioidaceae bacterium]|uniref:Uncharacterized protein n=1 Tax=uncultured Nocardioidaceae bacterium TaxID=253824 RepID=A0A6J4M750_9ACTN|nr:MAG: hypothetical protein AVDCRST_MAG34-1802 [uncultured Nocardioidaceae bacterium]
MSSARRVLADNGLGLFFAVIFLMALVGQFFAGLAQFNNDQHAEGLDTITWADYLTSADFVTDVTENWQSEYLQFLLYILATVWLIQRGSPESAARDEAGRESDADQMLGEHTVPESPRWARTGGVRTTVLSNSLVLAMGLIFLVSWLVQSIGGWGMYNETRLQRMQDPLTYPAYLLNADFWSRTLQNWQSEFLAVGSMAVLSIYLRQRGSPESKPVGAAHADTGETG